MEAPTLVPALHCCTYSTEAEEWGTCSSATGWTGCFARHFLAAQRVSFSPVCVACFLLLNCEGVFVVVPLSTWNCYLTRILTLEPRCLLLDIQYELIPECPRLVPHFSYFALNCPCRTRRLRAMRHCSSQTLSHYRTCLATSHDI